MTRRSLLGGLAAAILLGAGGAAFRFHLFGRRYPPTPYDDLLSQLDDREPARFFGQAVLKAMPGATAHSLAERIRGGSGSLASRAARQPAQGQVMEIRGWIVPRSVALYAALAASA